MNLGAQVGEKSWALKRKKTAFWHFILVNVKCSSILENVRDLKKAFRIYHLQEVRANVYDSLYSRTCRGFAECGNHKLRFNFCVQKRSSREKSIMILSCIIHPHGIILNPVIRWLFWGFHHHITAETYSSFRLSLTPSPGMTN